MDLEKKPKKSKKENKLSFSGGLKKLVSKLNTLDFWTDSEINNIDGKAEGKRQREIDGSFKGLNDKFKERNPDRKINENTDTSEGYLELINSLVMNDKNKMLTPEKLVEQIVNSKNPVFDIENLERNDKINFIKEIIGGITTVNEAITIFADSIVSPDSFDLTSFNFKVENSDLTQEMKDAIDEIKEMYELENDIRKFIKEALTYGVCYVAIVKYQDYFGRNLNQNKTEVKTQMGTFYSESMSDTVQTHPLLETVMTEMGAKGYKDKDELNAYLSENIDVYKSFQSFMGADIKLAKEVIDKHNKKDASAENVSGEEQDVKDKKKKNKISGGFYKKLDVSKVIPLTIGDLVTGYLYIETEEKDSKTGAQTNLSNREQLIKALSTSLLKNLDIEFVEKNPKLNKIIYTLLEENRLKNKKIKVTYLDVKDIYVFKHGSGVYGESLIENVLFACKIYMALFLRTVMLKISRSKDRRMIYVEVDSADPKVEETINSFVRDFRSKETTLQQELSISNSVQTLGVFEDYFVPVINGEKSFEVTTMDGSDAQVQDDFLEWLLKQILDGIGVPLELLGYSTAEFSRTVAMINGKFLKAVVSKQIQFEKSTTNFFRTLISLHQGDTPNIDDLTVTFNRPLSLAQQNLIDQINNKTEIAQFFTNNILGENNTDADLRDKVTKHVVRSLTPNIDWAIYDDILEKAKLELKQAKLEKAETEEGNSEEGMDENPEESNM